MRFDIIIRRRGVESSLAFTAGDTQRFTGFRHPLVLGQVHEYARSWAGVHARAFGIHMTPDVEVEVRCLSLIPHREEYQGPGDPDWERMIARLNLEHRITALCQFLDGVAHTIEEMDSGATHRAYLRRHDYAYARDLLVRRGYGYDTACRIALAATVKLFAGRPLGLYEPL